MIYMLILFPLVMAAATFALPFDRQPALALALGGPGASCLGRLGRYSGLETALLSRGWEAGCCSILLASSSSGS